MPHEYYQKAVQRELNVSLGPANSYGCGLIFAPHADDSVAIIRDVFQAQAQSLGFKIIGWRTLETGRALL